MEANTAPPNITELMEFFTRQQVEFQIRMQAQFDANSERLASLSSKATLPRRAPPPTYEGVQNEDLELWFFAIEQYYADYHPLMEEDSPAFETMVSCHLGVTPMNWYRQFAIDCDRQGVARSWPLFKQMIRKRFLPPDFEFLLRERLFRVTQTCTLEEYISDFQNILVQTQVPITALEERFYFAQGLRSDVAQHVREHHPATLAETIDVARRFATNETRSSNTEWTKTATCHRCKQIGHIAPNCPQKMAAP